MTPRERNLAIVIGAVLAIVVLYNGVHYVFITPYREAVAELEELSRDEARLDDMIRSREHLARRWKELVARTFSFDRPEALDRFGQSLKEIAKRHHFEKASFSTSVGTQIGAKTGISTVAHRISSQGGYADVLALLHAIYQTPYLTQVTRLSLSSISDKGVSRGSLKYDLVVESPLMPRIKESVIPETAGAEPMPLELVTALEPFRANQLRPSDYFASLEGRNIFRAFVPAPPALILVDNKDWKTVVVKGRFEWDGKSTGQPVTDVAGNATKSVEGKGDVVELTAFYSDGETYGPIRFDPNQRMPWTFQVPSHTPPPPPTVVDLAVTNTVSETVDIEVTVTRTDGTTIKKPIMRIPSGTYDIDVYESRQVTVAAIYPSGKRSQPEPFSPLATKQTYLISPEPVVEVPVETGEAPVEVVRHDPPPDGKYMVTALWTYTDRLSELQQELIATAGGERRYIRAGESGAIDGGTLVAVHPLGGVVKMPSGNYYLYLAGRSFDDRISLVAQSEEEVATAIDAWTRK